MNTCERHGRIRCGECAYIEQLEEERQKLIEGLRFYGDEETYEGDVEWDDAGNIIHAKWAPINLDNGQRARDILKEIGVTVE